MREARFGEALRLATRASLALSIGYLVTKGALLINGNKMSRPTYGGWTELKIEDDISGQIGE